MSEDAMKQFEDKMHRVVELLDKQSPTIEDRNELQKIGVLHPYTCGGNRGDDAHRKYAEEHGEDWGQLVATESGWVCPVCDYKQEF